VEGDIVDLCRNGERSAEFRHEFSGACVRIRNSITGRNQDKIANSEGGWSASVIGLNSCVCICANNGFVCGCDRGMNVRQKIGCGTLRICRHIMNGAPRGSVPRVRKIEKGWWCNVEPNCIGKLQINVENIPIGLISIDKTPRVFFNDFSLAFRLGMISRREAELNTEHPEKGSPEFAHEYEITIRDDLKRKSVV
jgi:hypothetical protein